MFIILLENRCIKPVLCILQSKEAGVILVGWERDKQFQKKKKKKVKDVSLTQAVLN